MSVHSRTGSKSTVAIGGFSSSIAVVPRVSRGSSLDGPVAVRERIGQGTSGRSTGGLEIVEHGQPNVVSQSSRLISRTRAAVHTAGSRRPIAVVCGLECVHCGHGHHADDTSNSAEISSCRRTVSGGREGYGLQITRCHPSSSIPLGSRSRRDFRTQPKRNRRPRSRMLEESGNEDLESRRTNVSRS